MLDLATYIPVSSPWLILLFSQKKTKKTFFFSSYRQQLARIMNNQDNRSEKTKIENLVRQT